MERKEDDKKTRNTVIIKGTRYENGYSINPKTGLPFGAFMFFKKNMEEEDNKKNEVSKNVNFSK